MKQIEFTRINNDVNGNPRYVCHFLNLLSEGDKKRLDGMRWGYDIETRYAWAVNNAKKIGGKKYHAKNYGGGIVFQSYNIEDTERRILELVNGHN